MLIEVKVGYPTVFEFLRFVNKNLLYYRTLAHKISGKEKKNFEKQICIVYSLFIKATQKAGLFIYFIYHAQ